MHVTPAISKHDEPSAIPSRHAPPKSGTFEAGSNVAHPWLRRVGILNDYVRVPYANGSSFASQWLYRSLSARGHQVSVVGPHDPAARADELPDGHLSLRSLPLRNHPGVHLALPSGADLADLRARKLDLVIGQTSSGMMDAGVWLRDADGVPLVMVNTVHLPSVYNTLLPESLDRNEAVHVLFRKGLVPFAESQTVHAYNRGDGLVVLSEGLERYWRDRGVDVPIHVIPRAMETRIFDRPAKHDPFDPRASRGKRLLVVCRHVREKGVARLLRLLAEDVFPMLPDATLTLVGDGPDHDTFVALAEELRISDRTFFVGEKSLVDMPDWYAYADLFVYASLSETYGQVISEALYAGLPVVAFADGMGVSGQVRSNADGILVPPGPDGDDADRAFAAAVLSLLTDVPRRRAYGERARELARLRSDPRAVFARYEHAFSTAREHLARTWRPSAIRPAPLLPLFRWAGIQSLVLGLGLLRDPAQLNRAGAHAPDWALRHAS